MGQMKNLEIDRLNKEREEEIEKNEDEEDE